jgi:hypothetical protein
LARTDLAASPRQRPAYTVFFTQQFLAKQTWLSSFTHHTPSDLASYDFFLFSKMKLKLKGRRFDTIEDIQAE